MIADTVIAAFAVIGWVTKVVCKVVRKLAR